MLLLAAVPVHVALSLGWALLLAACCRAAATVAWGDGSRAWRSRRSTSASSAAASRASARCALWPQILDHVAYGATVGAVLSARRR